MFSSSLPEGDQMDPYGYPLRPFLSMPNATASLYSSHGPYIFGPADSQGHRAAGYQQNNTQTQRKYRVRVINPRSKRDYMDLTWHDMSETFSSVVKLKESLIESFPEYVPCNLDFQIGYLEGRSSQKRWIVRAADLQKMYEAHVDGEEIKLWCEGKSKECSAQGKKRKSDEHTDHDQPPSKRECREEEEREIRMKLEKKHSNKYSGPQYNLWAKFIRMGRHEDYDTPPAIPLITGEQKGQAKTRVSDALVGAATAITNVLTSQTPSPSALKNSGAHSHALSPNNQANLRRKHLEDLRMLSQLRDDGVLTNEEFQEQKGCIMSGLKKLTYDTM